MKLLRLTIENIASIEQADIDFTRPPLSTTPLFLITGETGAGKSTLLDAISLALFNNTPRLADRAEKNSSYYGVMPTQRTAASSTSAAPRGKAISATDPHNLLRRGCSHGSVDLRFEAIDHRTYDIHWETGLSRNTTYKAIVHTLSADGQLITQKTSETCERVAQLIGMDMRQFFRTVMLAQGAFTNFLKSSAGEKASVLERITHTEEYSQLGRNVYQLCAQAEKEYRAAEATAAAITTLGADELTALDSQLAELDGQLAELTQQQQQTEEQRRWLTEHDQLRAQLAASEEQLCKAREALRSEAMTALTTLRTDWDLTAEARLHFGRHTEALRREAAATSAVEALQRRYRQLLSVSARLTQLRSELQQQLEQARQVVATEEPMREVYASLPAIEELLTRLEAEQRAAHEAEQQQRAAQEALPRVLEALRVQTAEAERLAQQLAAQQQTSAQFSAELQALQPDRLRAEQEHLSERLLLLQRAQQTEATTQRELQLWQEAAAGWRAEREELAQCVRTVAQLGARLPADEELYAAAQRQYDTATLILDDTTRALRARLHEGDPCPVCGRTIEHLLSDEATRQRFEPLRQLLEQARQQRDTTAGALAAEQRLQQQHELHLQARSTAQEAARTAAEAHLQQLAELLGQPLTPMPSAEAPALAEQLTQLGQERTRRQQEAEAATAEIKRQQAQVEALRRRMDEAARQHAATEQQLRAATEARHAADADRIRLQGETARLNALIQQSLQAAEELRSKLSVLLTTVADWQPQWEADRTAFAQQLRHRAQHYQAAVEQTAVLQGRLERADAVLSHTGRQQQEALRLQPEWSAATASPFEPNQLHHAEEEWEGLVRELHTARQSRHQAAAEAEQEAQWVAAFAQSHPPLTLPRIAELSAVVDIGARLQPLLDAEAAEARARAAAETVAAQLADAARRRPPHLSEQDTATSIAQRARQQADLAASLLRRQGELRQQFQLNQQQAALRRAAQADAQTKRAAYEEWAQLNELFGSSSGSRLRDVAQSRVLGRLLHNANQYLVQLSDRYLLEAIPGTLHISILDRTQRHVKNPVESLSGGESFLVSLALALALSTVEYSTLGIDTLFIDEGFGTLSEDRLDEVVKLLSSLPRLRNCRVGIISHMKQLYERIPVHIEVNRLNDTRSRITIVDTTAPSAPSPLRP